MLFKEFNDDAQCGTCGKRVKDLVDGKVHCRPCKDKAHEHQARAGVFQHLSSAAACLFSFDFIGFVVEVLWAIQRLTRTGDYGKQGRFTRILNKPRD